MLLIFKVALIVLILFVFVVYAVGSMVYLHRSREKGQSQALLVVLLGAMFVLVVLSLAILLHHQVVLGKANGGENASWMSLITLTLSIAAIIPFAVTKALTEKEIDSMVNSAIGQKQKQLYNEIDAYVLDTKCRIHQVDSDESRMIGYLLMTSPNPDYVWSLSWLMRALIYYDTVLEEQRSQGKHLDLNYVYITQCLTFIRKDLVEILKQSDDDLSLADYFQRYDAEVEVNYNNGVVPVAYTNTIFRVQHHIMNVHDALDRDKYGIQYTNIDLLRREVTMLMRWLIVQIDQYCGRNNVTYETVNNANHREIDCAKEQHAIEVIHQRYRKEIDAVRAIKC